ncbi:MAG: hypothetical protein ACLUEK_07725 [Oscillospiraceae bacterium]
MIIRKMQADFGCLRASHRARPGLNIIRQPNESVSTWCAFIRAMLYASTRLSGKSRVFAGQLRYAPGRARRCPARWSWNTAGAR